MTKKIDRTVELVLRLESAARMSTGEEARDFKDAAHRLGTYAAACQGFSKDLADIAEENARLAAEVARLREAGFELHRQIGVHEANAALLESDVARLTQAKDGAYRERNMLVCALTKVFPSWLARHPETDTEWENDWRWIIFVQLPTGQASWHIHDSERAMFDHLPVGMNSWDGHTNDEKYQRIAALTARKDGA